MVACNHCLTGKVPKNNLVRKENHLRNCQAYQIAVTLQQQQQQQQSQQQRTQQVLSNADTDDDNNNNISNTGTDVNESNNAEGSHSLATNVDVLPLDVLQASIANRALRAKPGNSRAGMLARGSIPAPRYSSNGDGYASSTGGATVADDIYSGVPYLYPAGSGASNPYAVDHPNSLRSLMAATEAGGGGGGSGRKRQRGVSPGLPNESTSPAARMSDADARRTSGWKKLKYAEFYLDEDDFEFVSRALTPREERFREIVERLARLVRLRDTRGM